MTPSDAIPVEVSDEPTARVEVSCPHCGLVLCVSKMRAKCPKEVSSG